ncbi:MAG: hypothetical protein Q9222_002219 [Ikaeria aurantiellina]
MSTGNKWFVPDDDFLAATEDYAVVNASNTWVQSRLMDAHMQHPDDCTCGKKKREHTFHHLIRYPVEYMDLFTGTVDTKLVYADVDRDDQDHRETCANNLKQGFLQEETEKTKEAKEKLLDHIETEWFGIETDSEEDEDVSTEGKKKLILKRFEECTRGAVPEDVVDYVLGLEDEEIRRGTMILLSNQRLHKTPRPVLFLLSMTHKFSKVEAGLKEGWVAAYNPINNLIIIKPFTGSKNKHPLAEKWTTELPDDGISFSGSPSSFVRKFLELESQIDGQELEKDLQNSGYRLVVHLAVMDWIHAHWDALASIKPEDGKTTMTEDEDSKVHELTRRVAKAASKIPLEVDDAEAAVKDPVPTMRYMQMMLEDYESRIRSEAVKAKDAGKGNAAENAAKLYGQLLEQLQSFNMDPEKDS